MKVFLAAALLAFLLPAAAHACPDISLFGDRYSFTGDQLYTAKRFSVRAGGENSIQACGIRPNTDRGAGYVTTAPDFSIQVTGMQRYTLVISTTSACDSVLLINTGAANWYYDDDDNGNLDARISLNRPSNGWLDVWVGTHDGSYCDATLSLETF